MTLWDTIILGALEGFTEFLPISSTGHLILAAELLGLPSTEFLKSFQIAIQLGAIAAVVLLYFRSFLNIEVLKKLFVAFLPTGLVGFLVYPYVKGFLLGNSLVVVGALFLGGVALIVFERIHKERWTDAIDLKDISYKQAVLVGLFQSIAIIPGVSRSAATIVGGLLVGLPRVSIVEFSFLLAVPTMVAATGYDLLKSAHSFTASDTELMAIGFIVSFAVALASMKLLLSIVKRFSFVPFGIYRIVVAVLFFAIVIL